MFLDDEKRDGVEGAAPEEEPKPPQRTDESASLTTSSKGVTAGKPVETNQRALARVNEPDSNNHQGEVSASEDAFEDLVHELAQEAQHTLGIVWREVAYLQSSFKATTGFFSDIVPAVASLNTSLRALSMMPVELNTSLGALSMMPVELNTSLGALSMMPVELNTTMFKLADLTSLFADLPNRTKPRRQRYVVEQANPDEAFIEDLKVFLATRGQSYEQRHEAALRIIRRHLPHHRMLPVRPHAPRVLDAEIQMYEHQAALVLMASEELLESMPLEDAPAWLRANLTIEMLKQNLRARAFLAPPGPMIVGSSLTVAPGDYTKGPSAETQRRSVSTRGAFTPEGERELVRKYWRDKASGMFDDEYWDTSERRRKTQEQWANENYISGRTLRRLLSRHPDLKPD
ncbi:MAG: hypothetical protein GXY79_05575 [Chloroflexi bacterium]|nr:hypothetical protein [Chloroflexota bacterium]